MQHTVRKGRRSILELEQNLREGCLATLDMPGHEAHQYTDRPDLTVLSHALVTRVLFEGRRAMVVECSYDSHTHHFGTALAVVLSLGAIQTPTVDVCSAQASALVGLVHSSTWSQV